jgi:HEAT repeat protein
MNRASYPLRFWATFLLAVLLYAVSTNSLVADDEEAQSFKDGDFSHERVAVLMEQLNSEVVIQRVKAVVRLGMLGPEARSVVPKLIELLSDEAYFTEFGMFREYVNEKASNALVGIGSEAVGGMGTKVLALPLSGQQHGIFAARRMGPKARAFLPEFLRRYEIEKDESLRIGLLEAIAAIDPTGKTAVPRLVQAIGHADKKWERKCAALRLTPTSFLEQVYWKERVPSGEWFRDSPEFARVAANALLAALEDPSSEVRGPAAITLSSFPEVAKRAAPVLLKLLRDQDVYEVAHSNHVGGQVSVSSAAVRALSRMHSEADQILPELVKVIDGPGYLGDTAFIELIPHSKQPLKYIEPLLRSDHPEGALIAAARLGEKSVISKVEALRKHEDSRISVYASLALACIDPEGHPQSVELVQRVLVADPPRVCHFLQAVGPHAAFAVTFLKEHILDKKDVKEVNYDVVRALEAIGSAATAASSIAPEVIDRLGAKYTIFDDEKEDVLVLLGPAVVPELILALADPGKSPQHRICCFRVLGRFHRQAADAVPAVVSHIRSEYPRVRESAATALGEIASRPSDSLPALQRLASDPRPFVRAAAVESSGAFGPASGPVVPTLIKHLSDDYLDVRVSAASALGRLGPVANQAIPKLEELKDTDSVLLRDTVREALAAIRAN